MKTILLLILCFFSAYAQECQKVKAAFDLGSGTTRMAVARLDTCQKKVIKILMESEKPVAYQEDIKGQVGDIKFTPNVQKVGLSVLKEFKEQVGALNVQEWSGVASAAFRIAKNAREYLDLIGRETGIRVRIVTQEEEAQLGFNAVQVYQSQLAKTKKNIPTENLLVWDIGAGSMQMTMRKNGRFDFYNDSLASVTFKDMALKSFYKEQSGSPNPLGDKTQHLLKMASDYAKRNLPSTWRELKKGQEVMGIGGVHYHSIRPMVNKDSYTQKDLREILYAKKNSTDQQLGGGPYVSTMMTNIVLVLGFMQVMGVERVYPAKVNLALGELLNN